MCVLGDDDALEDIDPGQLGSIQIEIFSIIIVGQRRCSPPPVCRADLWSGPVHERSKKAGNHAVQYVGSPYCCRRCISCHSRLGRALAPSKARGSWYSYKADPEYKEHICSFKFKYGSEGELQNVATKYILIGLMRRIDSLRAKGYINTPPRQYIEETYTSPVRQSVKSEERSEECERHILQILHVIRFRAIAL
jgi:hypothetical protein